MGSSRSKNCNGSPNVSINLLARSIGNEVQFADTARLRLGFAHISIVALARSDFEQGILEASDCIY